jgi:site-specific DNA-cytosine methylase
MGMARNSKGDTIKTACAIDIWEIACKTFEHNLGLTPVCEPIDDDLIRKVEKEHGPFDIVVGGPP